MDDTETPPYAIRLMPHDKLAIIRALDNYDIMISARHFELHEGPDPKRCIRNECVHHLDLLDRARHALGLVEVTLPPRTKCTCTCLQCEDAREHGGIHCGSQACHTVFKP